MASGISSRFHSIVHFSPETTPRIENDNSPRMTTSRWRWRIALCWSPTTSSATEVKTGRLFHLMIWSQCFLTSPAHFHYRKDCWLLANRVTVPSDRSPILFRFCAGDNLKPPWIGQTLPHQRAIFKLAKISISQVTPAVRKQGKVYANQCHQIQRRVKMNRCIWDHLFYHKDVHSFLIPFPVNQSQLSKLMSKSPWYKRFSHKVTTCVSKALVTATRTWTAQETW